MGWVSILLQAEFAAFFGAWFFIWLLLIFIGIFVWWWIGSLSFRTKRIAGYLEATQANLHYIATWLKDNHEITDHIKTSAGSLASISRVFQEEQAYAHKDDAKPQPAPLPPSKMQEGWRPPPQ